MTTAPKTIQLSKRGLHLRLTGVDQEARGIIDHVTHYEVEEGFDKRAKRKIISHMYMREVDPLEPETIYSYDGLRLELIQELTAAGYNVVYNVVPSPFPVFQPDLSWASKVTMRPAQARFLSAILSEERGLFKAVPAMGKSHLIRWLCRCFPYPQARIVICTPGVGLVDAMRRELWDEFPKGTVGVCKSGSAIATERIVVSTPQSLGKIPPESVYMLLYDEVHTAAATETTAALLRFYWARMYGLSATPDGRRDGTGKRIAALFGKKLDEVTYKEAVDNGYVPNVDVFFYENRMPALASKDPQTQERHLVIHNNTRNKLVAEACNKWNAELSNKLGQEPQILVLVNRAEHAAVLKRFLPDYQVVFGHMAEAPKNRLLRQGYTEEELSGMNQKQVLGAQRGLESGGIKKAIVISTMGTGVDTRNLDVLVRADGGKSPVSNTQYPGRVMRGDRGIYVDFMDYCPPSSQRYQRASEVRRRNAVRMGMDVRILNFKTGQEIIPHGPGRRAGHIVKPVQLEPISHYG